MKTFFVNLWKYFIRSQTIRKTTSTVLSIKGAIYLKTYRFHFNSYQQKRRNSPPKNVLISLENAGIGNTVEATPMIQAVRMLWPDSDITLVTKHAELFNHWCVPNLAVDSYESLSHNSFDQSFFPYWCVRKRPNSASHMNLGKIHLTRLSNPNYFMKPEKFYYLDMVKKLGYKGFAPPLYVSMQPPSQKIAFDGPSLCIIPGGQNLERWRFKKWPYYPQLIDCLAEQYPNLKLYLIGTKQDIIDLKHDSKVIDLRGHLTLSETAWVLNQARCIIGNDCGPMHIASAVNTPSVAIFGPTCIIKNSYSANVRILYSDNLKCWPCQYNVEHLDHCQTGECIKNITLKQVMDATKKILDKAD